MYVYLQPHSHVSHNKIPAVMREGAIELNCFLFMVFYWQQIVSSCNSFFMYHCVINYFVAAFYSLIIKTELKLFFALIIYQTWIAQISYLVAMFNLLTAYICKCLGHKFNPLWQVFIPARYIITYVLLEYSIILIKNSFA